jgi:glycerol-1-phosphatase
VIVDRYDSFLFDLDGVLYRGSEPVPGAAEVVDAIRERGKPVAFMTNNSARTPDEVVAHLRSVGVRADVDEVETSALATAKLLSERDVRSAFVIGETGLVTALRDANITVVDVPPALGAHHRDGRDGTPPDDGTNERPAKASGERHAGDERSPVVVVGLDRHLTYERLRDAALLVERGSSFVASNADASFPAEDGAAWPGAGAISAVIETTTGVAPEIVGKPHAPLLRSALARAGGRRPLVIGDRLDTDIAGAVGLGWDSLLVLTGISTRADVRKLDPASRPTYVGDDLRVLLADPEPGRSPRTERDRSEDAPSATP